jgi:peptidoglycan lytic transglycosylase
VKFILALAFSFMILASLPAGKGGLLWAAQRRGSSPAGRYSALSSGESSGLIPASLRTLAARADRKQGWSALARYAKAAASREAKGLAYFTLGYREYQAHNAAAIADLAQAASTGFSLADYAEYYQGAAASQENKPEIAVSILARFRDRFPESVLQLDATRLLAWSLLGAGRPEDAIKVLQAAPQLSRQPPLQYLLGEAYQKAGDLVEAARTFQGVYYRSPGAAEAAPAGRALDSLQIQLGTHYPTPSEDLRATRASGLETAGRFGPALSAYEGVLRDFPTSAAAAARRLARDRCLTRLARTAEALADLSAGSWPPGAVDAERWLVILRARAALADEAGMLAALDELSNLYPQSPFYASGLDSAASYFIRKGDWARAGTYSARLVQTFPNADLAAKSRFQAAWADYLGGRLQDATKSFEQYAELYPSSRRAPAALYWLGRIAESDGRQADAQLFFTLLRRRFRNQYYSRQAVERSKLLELPERQVLPGAGPETPGGAGSLGALPAGLETAVNERPPAPDPSSFCPTSRLGPGERLALTFAALSLGDLAERDLRLRLEAGRTETAPDAPGLRLALARVQREREEYDRATYNARQILPNYADYDFSELPGDFWGLLYPEAFWSLVRQDARANRLDPYLVMALIREESGFNPTATSGAGARGLMQLLPQTASGVARENRGPRRRRRPAGNLNNPSYNLRIGCRYLGEMVQQFDGSLEQALAAYNAGPDRVKQWVAGRSFPEPAAFVESIPFAETRAYVEAVLRDAVVYRRLMTEKLRFKPCGPRS